jgi:hypothetical protein
MSQTSTAVDFLSSEAILTGTPLTRLDANIRPPATLISWHIVSDHNALVLSVTYGTDDTITTVEVEYCDGGIHGELPRTVEDDVFADLERHWSACERARYLEAA